MTNRTVAEQPENAVEDIRAALSAYDTETVHMLIRQFPEPDLKHVPGSSGVPVLGHGPFLLVNAHKWLNAQHARFGEVFRLNLPILRDADNRGAVFMLGPDANQLVLQNDGLKFSNYLAWNKNFKGLFDHNLLQRDFKGHKHLRKILQSAFKREAIEGHMELLNPILREGVNAWPKGKPIKSMNYTKELFLNAGSSVFLGVGTGEDTSTVNKAFVDIVSATADLLRKEAIWFSGYAKGVRARRFLTDFIQAKIPQRRQQATRDLLSHFCHLKDDAGEYFPDSEIRDQVLFVLFAAHDTTTSTISSVLYSIASNPQWQDAMRREMLALDKENVEFEDLDCMDNTSLVIKEALRMYPPLTMMPRYALESFDYGGYEIPAGTSVVISPLFSHYMEQYWSDPHTFDPLRFSPERAEDKKHLFQYVPFGGGAHKCLGLHFAQVQSKIFLFHLLKNFEVTKSPRMKQYRYNNVPLTFPTDGLPLTFSPIH